MSVNGPMVQSRDERLWGMLCHLSALSGLIIVPIGFILGPLIVWLIKKDQYEFVNDQGKEALNFQISMFIYAAIAAPLILIFIGLLLIGAIIIVDVVFTIVASIAANEGRAYRYPLTIRLIR